MGEDVGMDSHVLAVLALVLPGNGNMIDPQTVVQMTGLDKDPVDKAVVKGLVRRMTAVDQSLGFKIKPSEQSAEFLRLCALLSGFVEQRAAFKLLAASEEGANVSYDKKGDTEEEKGLMAQANAYQQLEKYTMVSVPLHEQLDYELVAKLYRMYKKAGHFGFEIMLESVGYQVNKRSVRKDLGNKFFTETEEVHQDKAVRFYQVLQTIYDIFMAVLGILSRELRADDEPKGGGQWLVGSSLEPGSPVRVKQRHTVRPTTHRSRTRAQARMEATLPKILWMIRATQKAVGQHPLYLSNTQFHKIWVKYNRHLQEKKMHHDTMVDYIAEHNAETFELTQAEKDAVERKKLPKPEAEKESGNNNNGKSHQVNNQNNQNNRNNGGGRNQNFRPGGFATPPGNYQQAGNFVQAAAQGGNPNSQIGCSEFWFTGQCRRGRNCQYNHGLPPRAAAGGPTAPPGGPRPPPGPPPGAPPGHP